MVMRLKALGALIYLAPILINGHSNSHVYFGKVSAFSFDKVYQLLAHDRWFSPSISASSTTKTGRHDIAEIFLKVALNTNNQIKSNQCNFND
jgi:hypothetical protein